jgi:Mrp family chromosome partitioning ATPase
MKRTARLTRRKRVDHAAVPDDALILHDEYGNAVQLVPPAVVGAMRSMVARVRVGDGTDLPKRIGVTSSIPGEGVTFIARTLALLLTNDTRKRVCLVDLNWWSSTKPAASEHVGPGVADVVGERAELGEALEESGTPGLSIISSGVASLAERSLLSNGIELDRMLTDLDDEFDHLVLDLPAMSASADSLTLAHKASAVLFVIRQGVTPEADTKHALEQLKGVSVLGALLNRSSSKIPAVIRRRVVGT